jgi:hypothetical protein
LLILGLLLTPYFPVNERLVTLELETATELFLYFSIWPVGRSIFQPKITDHLYSTGCASQPSLDKPSQASKPLCVA